MASSGSLVDVVLGLQWGDEGKGAVADRMAAKSRYHLGLRPYGGPNAAHLVTIGEKRIVLRQIPATILRGKTSLLGSEMVVNVIDLFTKEMQSLKEAGISTDNLLISDRASLLMPWHIAEDRLQEESRGNKKIGTTCQGIGPAYRDHANRSGLRLADFAKPQVLWSKILKDKLEEVTARLKALFPDFDVDEFIHEFPYERLEQIRVRLARHVIDVPEFLSDARARGQGILIEAAQGTMLDVRHGTYPYVTSSHASIHGCLEGTGIAPNELTNVFGVLKAYTTRVGEGPFPSRMDPETEKLVRQLGNEKGTGTGRDRNCGWIDFVQLKYAARLNGVTGLIVTKFDFFHQLPHVKACVMYKRELEKKPIHHVPADMTGIEGILVDIKGWSDPVRECQAWDSLPFDCREFLLTISLQLEAPLSMLSLGPDRTSAIELTLKHQKVA